MKTIFFSLILFCFTSSFSQTQKFYFIQHLSPLGLEMFPCSKDIATHYTLVDPDFVTSGYVTYFFMNGAKYSVEYYENREIQSRKVYYKNGRKCYVQKRIMMEIGSVGTSEGYNVPLFDFPFQIQNAWDTTGQKSIKKGVGTVTETDTSGHIILITKINLNKPYNNNVDETQGFYSNGNLMYISSSHFFAKSINGDTLVKKGNGTFVSKFANDSLYAKLHFSYGRLMSKTQGFYPNGQYINATNLPDGKFAYYYNNGQVRKTGEWLKGYPSGEWIWYDRKGAIIDRRTYTEFNLFMDCRF